MILATVDLEPFLFSQQEFTWNRWYDFKNIFTKKWAKNGVFDSKQS
jgi:hypothetical protein